MITKNTIKIPDAPGNIMSDEAEEDQRRLYIERFQALEEALRAIVGLLPYGNDRLEFTCDYDSAERYEYVRLRFSSSASYENDPYDYEFAFYPNGDVCKQESPMDGPEWAETTWRDGASRMLADLRRDAELDREMATKRLGLLNSIAID